MHEIPRQVIVSLPRVFGIDLSITNEVVLLWAAALVTFVTLTLANRGRGAVAHGWFQNVVEALSEFIEHDVVAENLGQKAATWASFLVTLFFFLLFASLLGMLPAPHHVKAMTSSFSVTAALAFLVFALTIGVNIHYHGFGGFARKFAPGGIPRWLWILIVPIEVISWLAKPFSLAIRLFANMMAGHTLIVVFVLLIMRVGWLFAALPYAGAIVMSAFELFVSFIQAFIFTMLAATYIKDALEGTH